jgi:hypothetical protein
MFKSFPFKIKKFITLVLQRFRVQIQEAQRCNLHITTRSFAFASGACNGYCMFCGSCSAARVIGSMVEVGSACTAPMVLTSRINHVQ